jgi:hypothetical protein
MADYSHEDAAYATRIVERLVNREVEDLELDQDLVVSDVESDANTFSDELSLLEEFDADVPAVPIAGETVPVSLEVALGRSERWPLFPISKDRPWRRGGNPFFYQVMYDYLRPILGGEGLFEGFRSMKGFRSMSRQEAKSTFVKRAADFVATRVAAVRGFRDGWSAQPWNRPSLYLRPLLSSPPVPTPGCNFTVSTNSNGLRVFWSGAYYVTPNNFNHPTTPTSSVLQSGTYIFGVDGGAYGNNLQWDFNLVVTLPGQPYAHLNF